MTGAPDTWKRLALLLPTPWKPAWEYSPYQFAIVIAISLAVHAVDPVPGHRRARTG